MRQVYKQEFIGFTFCDIHSSQFNVYAISDGSRYSQSLFAEFTDSVETVDGHNGSYYFGTHFTNKPRSIKCYVEEVDENTLRDIQYWLNPTRIGKLTFDEAPYKYYMAKVTSPPQLDFVPQGNGFGGHLYSGFFTIEMTAYNPFAYSYVNSVDDYTYYEESQALWYYDSGILYRDITPSFIHDNITGTTEFYLYNGGNTRTKPIITIQGSADAITVANLTTKQNFTLSNLNNIKITVDCQKGHVRVVDVLASSYHEGDYIELEGSGRVDRLTASFINGSNIVNTNEAIPFNIIGRYIACAGDWYKVIDCNFDTNTITLDKAFKEISDEYEVSIIDLNKINISGVNMNISSIEFDYKFCYY